MNLLERLAFLVTLGFLALVQPLLRGKRLEHLVYIVTVGAVGSSVIVALGILWIIVSVVAGTL